MANPTSEFFARLAERGVDPWLRHPGTMRIDLEEGRRTVHWMLSVVNGRIKLWRGGGAADAILRADRTLFDRLVTGECNAMAAILRGALVIEGDTALLVQFQRLLPGPKPQSAAARAMVKV